MSQRDIGSLFVSFTLCDKSKDCLIMSYLIFISSWMWRSVCDHLRSGDNEGWQRTVPSFLGLFLRSYLYRCTFRWDIWDRLYRGHDQGRVIHYTTHLISRGEWSLYTRFSICPNHSCVRNTWKTPHSSPLRVDFGVSFVSSWSAEFVSSSLSC